MESKLTRIIADDVPSSWGNWATDLTHKSLQRGFLGRFTPTRSQIETAGATVAATASGIKGLFVKSGTAQINELAISQVLDMTDAEGNKLTVGSIYAAHPIITNTMLRADALHSYIIKEQRAQIIRYFRSAVALKSLTIEVICENNGSHYAGGGWKLATASAGKDTKEEQRHWFTARYNTPRKEVNNSCDDLFWMPYFDEVLAATNGAAGGYIESITTLNTSFGISAEAASLANIDSNWISNQSFVIRAEYI